MNIVGRDLPGDAGLPGPLAHDVVDGLIREPPASNVSAPPDPHEEQIRPGPLEPDLAKEAIPGLPGAKTERSFIPLARRMQTSPLEGLKSETSRAKTSPR